MGTKEFFSNSHHSQGHIPFSAVGGEEEMQHKSFWLFEQVSESVIEETEGVKLPYLNHSVYLNKYLNLS